MQFERKQAVTCGWTILAEFALCACLNKCSWNFEKENLLKQQTNSGAPFFCSPAAVQVTL